MTALLRAELIKLRTTRTFLALTGVAVGTSLLICVLVSLLSEPTQESVLTDVFTADTSALFIVILAIVGITGEWRHRTITSSLLAAPDRLRFLLAKTLAFAAAGLLLSLLISIAVAIVGMIILSARDLPTPSVGDLIGQIIRNAEVAALLGAFGLGLGSLVRNQPVAIVGVLVLGFAIEPTVIALAPDVGRFAPFSALSGSIQEISASDVGFDEGTDLLPRGVAVLAMLAWIAVPFTAGAVLLRRRDLN
jgi:ABC-2 type transport system permease protein